MFLVGWDDTIGCTILAKYPPGEDLSSDAMLQYLATVQALGQSPTVQVQDERQSTLIYGIPPDGTNGSSRRAPVFIVLLLDESDLGKIKRLRLLLARRARASSRHHAKNKEGCSSNWPGRSSNPLPARSCLSGSRTRARPRHDYFSSRESAPITSAWTRSLTTG
jgi:hypothetical protein